MILAIDQSTVKTGYSIWGDKQLMAYGLIDLSNIDNVNLRINKMVNKIIEICDKYGINNVVLEGIQFQRNVHSFETLAHLKGCLINEFIYEGIGYNVVHVKTWKSYCGIKGKKRKEQKVNTIIFIKDRFNIDVLEDVADSIGIGWYWVNQ